MANKTAIEWSEATLNPWTGCTKVSPGCANCYIARTPPFRTKGRDFVKGHIPLEFHMERLEKMVARKKPTMYFVNSLSDLFHEDASREQIAMVFNAMMRAPQHTFQVLTKRPERMRQLLSDDRFWDTDRPLRNVWLGTSIENRRFANRADILRDTPAAVRFISAEPLLGPLRFDDEIWLGSQPYGSPGESYMPAWVDKYDGPQLDLTGIDWLIVGGESGPGYRPMKLNWVRDLRDAARASGTAFFMKQLGGSRPGNSMQELPPDLCIREYPTSVRPGESYEQMTLA